MTEEQPILDTQNSKEIQNYINALEEILSVTDYATKAHNQVREIAQTVLQKYKAVRE